MTERISRDQYFANLGKPRSKFGNERTAVDGETFDSKREANRWRELRLMQRGGLIRNLKRQVEYEFRHQGVLICTYRADFTYEHFYQQQWRFVVEDAKGMPTPAYKIKKALMKAFYDIEILET